MAKKKAVKKPIKVAKSTKTKKPKKKKIAEYNGIEIDKNADGTLVCEKRILNPYSTNKAIWYKCRFADRTWKMVPAEALKGFIK